MQTSFNDQAWFEHLTAGDWTVIERIAPSAGVEPGATRDDVDALGRVLAHPAAHDAVFRAGDDAATLAVSPFLAFALIVHRGWQEVLRAQHVDEWVGPHQRLPVLGAGELREFLAVPAQRLFLTELLASYTRVVSGVTWVATRRGWRRRRFSELDPLRLASLLEVVPEDERAGVYRRLGDLALFLTGVFPDHVATHGITPLDAVRLARLAGLRPDSEPAPIVGTADITVDLFERLGGRWYALAAQAARPLTAPLRVVADVGTRFQVARRTLNYLTDTHLFGDRSRWLLGPSA